MSSNPVPWSARENKGNTKPSYPTNDKVFAASVTPQLNTDAHSTKDEPTNKKLKKATLKGVFQDLFRTGPQPICTSNEQIDAWELPFSVSESVAASDAKNRYECTSLALLDSPLTETSRLGLDDQSIPTQQCIHEHCQLFNSWSGKITDSIMLSPQQHSLSPSLPTLQFHAIDNPYTPDSCSKDPSANPMVAPASSNRSPVLPTKQNPVKQAMTINSDHVSKKKTSLAAKFVHHPFKLPSSAFKELIGSSPSSVLQHHPCCPPSSKTRTCFMHHCPICFMSTHAPCSHKHQIQLQDCTSHILHHQEHLGLTKPTL